MKRFDPIFLAGMLLVLLLSFAAGCCESEDCDCGNTQPAGDEEAAAEEETACDDNSFTCSEDAEKVLRCVDGKWQEHEICGCPTCKKGRCWNISDYCHYMPDSCDGNRLTLKRQVDEECCEVYQKMDCPASTTCSAALGCLLTQMDNCDEHTTACASDGKTVRICRDGQFKMLYECPCGCRNGECITTEGLRCTYSFHSCKSNGVEILSLEGDNGACCQAGLEGYCVAYEEACYPDRGCSPLILE